MGETCTLPQKHPARVRLSVSSNGSTWVKPGVVMEPPAWAQLSVSSNGSTWVKLLNAVQQPLKTHAFSILERIDVGETSSLRLRRSQLRLSVSSNGSTWVKRGGPSSQGSGWPAFSILERIDVGETVLTRKRYTNERTFQYPRTDRRG